MDLIEILKGKLIVSCQALEDEPLHGSIYMRKMALAAKEGGAAAIRANGVLDIKAIKEEVDLPIIGLIKRSYESCDVYITPTKKEIMELVESGCEIIAMDATNRCQITFQELKEKVDLVHQHGLLALADISTYNEGLNAEKAGFDIVSTTLSGYTKYSTQSEEPDYKLVKQLKKALKIPVIAEGRIFNDCQLKKMLKSKPHAIIIGSSITRPKVITERFVKVIEGSKK